MLGYYASLFAPVSLRQSLCASLFAPVSLRRVLRGLSLLALILSTTSLCSADNGQTLPTGKINFSWDAARQGQFILSLAAGRGGEIWCATEDNALWRYDPRADEPWTHVTSKDGLGDDAIQALAVDLRGRVWAGTGRSGVSVWNGKSWKTYDRLTGPLGARVTALAVNPHDGSVWGGTEAGLFRYAHEKWTYVTRADGLPSDQITCLAFTKTGTILAGTDCDGLALASPQDNYTHWRTVTGPARMPSARGGKGLPGGLINCVLASRKTGSLYVGTTCGLGRSEDGGKTWRFLRGEDWLARVTGLDKGPSPVMADTKGHILREDYVTTLAEDGAGRLLIGYRTKGVEVVDALTGTPVYPYDKQPGSGDFVKALLPLSDGSLLVGLYGGGVTAAQVLKGSAEAKAVELPSPASPKPVPFPAPASPPSSSQLQAMLRQVKALKPSPQMAGAYLGEDWQTQGDAIGRYGRQYAKYFAMQAPWGDHVPTNAYGYAAHTEMGPHHAPNDVLRHWVEWVRTDTRRSLYNPVIGYRRQAEDDDHGEDYEGQGFDGPDIWVAVTVPGGMQRVSLYFMNKDGHDGLNRNRDYLVELKPFAETLDRAAAGPILARGRVRDFWDGVHKSFLVRGPGKYYLKIGKNNSFNTIVSAVAIDKVQGPMGRFEDMQTNWLGAVHYNPPNPDAPAPATPEPVAKSASFTSPTLLPSSPAVKAARTLWAALDNSYDNPTGVALQQPYRIFAYRAAVAGGGSEALQGNWRWKLDIWTPEDRAAFADTMARAYQSLITLHPELNNQKR